VTPVRGSRADEGEQVREREGGTVSREKRSERGERGREYRRSSKRERERERKGKRKIERDGTAAVLPPFTWDQRYVRGDRPTVV